MVENPMAPASCLCRRVLLLLSLLLLLLLQTKEVGPLIIRCLPKHKAPQNFPCILTAAGIRAVFGW